MDMVCDLCFPGAIEHGELVPGHWLMEHEGKFSVISHYGHRPDIIFTFPMKPWSDPDPNVDHDGDEIAVLEDRWMSEVDLWWESLSLDPVTGYYLVDACKKVGWGVEMLSYWLFDRAGKMLEKKSEKQT